MNEISEADVQNNLAALLDRVEQGDELVITRAGKPVARLIGPAAKTKGQVAVEGLLELREQIAARGGLIPLEELLRFRDEGRR